MEPESGLFHFHPGLVCVDYQGSNQQIMYVFVELFGVFTHTIDHIDDFPLTDATIMKIMQYAGQSFDRDELVDRKVCYVCRNSGSIMDILGDMARNCSFRNRMAVRAGEGVYAVDNVLNLIGGISIF